MSVKTHTHTTVISILHNFAQRFSCEFAFRSKLLNMLKGKSVKKKSQEIQRSSSAYVTNLQSVELVVG